MQSSVLCLMGPTASGKTQLALQLADKFPIKLISVDSAMVYKGLDIGTAKPEKEILKKYPHALVDICDPAENYSAAQFQEDALVEIELTLKEEKIPCLVGGTMLYFKALQSGLANLPESNEQVRQKLNQIIQEKGLAYLYEELKAVDPEAAKKIHANDSQRIQRALEVYYLTDIPLSVLQKDTHAKTEHLNFINLALMPEDRKILHERIAKRFKQMLQQGFLDEVKQLYLRGDLSANLPAIKTVGYRQAWHYLEGKIDEATMEEQAIAATRQLAKRQITWLRHWQAKPIDFFDSEQKDLFTTISSVILRESGNDKKANKIISY